ncbi:MAG: hypothetical protein JW807_07715 [Spirochaetes bacterium]|nr:hypothetical protein [Spirochaetota bacterium]
MRDILIALLLTAGAAGGLHAAGFGTTVSFTRTQGRAGAVGTVDAAYYNPAGLASLKDGFYLDAGYQVMTKTVAYKITYTNGTDDTPSPFIPNFCAVYKVRNAALFLSLDMPRGVERVNFRKPRGGMPLISYVALGLDPYQMAALRSAGLTKNLGGIELPGVTYVKASRYWLQGRLGGSFSITENVAFAGGIACSYFEGDRSAGILSSGTIDKLERSGVGWSGFAGLMLGPPEKFVLTALYGTPVFARGKEKNVKYYYTHIMEQRLPDYLLIGLNLRTVEKASIQFSYRVDFSGERRYGSRNLLTRDHEWGFVDWLAVVQGAAGWSALPLVAAGNAQNYKHKNRHSFGITLELDIGNFTASSGISYMTQETYPRAQNPLDPDLARVGWGAGLRASAGNNLVIETGTAYYFYITDRMLYNSIKLNRSGWTWGVNVTLKAL